MNGVMLPGNTSAFTERLKTYQICVVFNINLKKKSKINNWCNVSPSSGVLCYRKVNGPGTPRPLNRPKVSLANSLAANGLPDSTDIKDLITEQENKDTR